MEVVMKTFRTIVMVAAFALAAAACGGVGDGGAGGGSDESIDHPTGPDEVVLRVALEGGFVPVEVNLARIPGWTLYGDGTVIVEGPQIEIYPPPALPNLLASRISEEGIQAILRAARDAGLMDGDASYDYPCITDVPTTVFTTSAGGATSVVSAYAIDASGMCPDVDEDARAALRDFVMELGNLASWLPEGAVGAEEPYVPSELRLYVSEYQPDPNLPQETVEWPLETPMTSPDKPGDRTTEDLSCFVLTGSDVDVLLPGLRQANTLTPWQSEGVDHRLIVRPLLPDEHGC